MAAVIREDELTGGQRYNLYSSIHKALRGFMLNTVTRVGQADVEDECELAQVIEQVRTLLQDCRSHLKHENEFVHPAMERVLRHSSQHTADDHVQHERTIAELESQVERLIAAPAVQRSFLTSQLYLRLTAFIAENLEHMLVEETDNHQALIAAYTDAELLQIKGAIVASIPPQDNMRMMKWMLEYMNNAERIAIVKDIKAHAPPMVFHAVMDTARSTLSQRDYFKLERALL